MWAVSFSVPNWMKHGLRLDAGTHWLSVPSLEQGFETEPEDPLWLFSCEFWWFCPHLAVFWSSLPWMPGARQRHKQLIPTIHTKLICNAVTALDGTWCSAMSVLTSSNSWGRGSLSSSPSVVSAHCSQLSSFSSSSWVSSSSARALESLCWCCRTQAVTWASHTSLIIPYTALTVMGHPLWNLTHNLLWKILS